MKKVLSILMVFALVFALAACGGAASSAAPASSAPIASSAGANSAAPAGDLAVGMLLPGTINDHGWNAEAYAGLELIGKEQGAEIKHSEKVAFSDFEEVWRGYAEMGCQMVFGHGYEFGESAMVVAPNYPDTFFVITSANVEQAPNVCSLQNLNNEQGFMAGVVAGLETKSNVVGVVGGMQVPSITLYVEGFKDGVKYVNPDCKVLDAYTGDFDDVAKVKETTLAMIKEGADIVSHNADQAGLGLFEAVKESEGVFAIGSVGDQYEQAPGKVITSATNEMKKAIALAGQYYADGTLEAKVYNFGIKEGVIGLADFRDYPISAENKATVEETMEQIVNGEIEVEYRATA